MLVTLAETQSQDPATFSWQSETRSANDEHSARIFRNAACNWFMTFCHSGTSEVSIGPVQYARLNKFAGKLQWRRCWRVNELLESRGPVNELLARSVWKTSIWNSVEEIEWLAVWGSGVGFKWNTFSNGTVRTVLNDEERSPSGGFFQNAPRSRIEWIDKLQHRTTRAPGKYDKHFRLASTWLLTSIGDVTKNLDLSNVSYFN